MKISVSASMLEIKKISKRFEDLPALADVDLTIKQGEFFSLLGPSGCGKTTLLRLIGGFESPCKGEILLGGQRLDHLPPQRRPTNMVFQHYALFPHLNVENNVAFGLKVQGMEMAQISKRVAEALELVQLRDYGKRHVSTLSGGQRQRVALARAIINCPQVLLLDEPLSALDQQLRLKMRLELLALQRQLGITFILVTHDQDEALTLSDRIGVMNGGRIDQVGRPQDVYDDPKTDFVARFLGCANTLVARLEGSANGLLQLKVAGGLTLQAARPAWATQVGQDYCIGLRPDSLTFLPVGATQSTNVIAGRIAEILFKGPTVDYVVIPVQKELAPLTVNVIRGEDKETFSKGSEVLLSCPPASVTLLQPSAGDGDEPC